MPIPRTPTELKRFIGLVKSFRDYIKDFAIIEAPLNRLTSIRDVKQWYWQDEHTQAYEILKQKVSEHAMLYHLDYQHPIVLHTDASTIEIGAVLQQIETASCFPESCL
jgi:hypothetical protein